VTHVCTRHQKTQGPRKRGCCLSGRWLSGLVSLWESVRRLCALRSDTVVQYAACLTSSSLRTKEGRYHSIPITLARQVVQILFSQVCLYILRNAGSRMLLIIYKIQEISWCSLNTLSRHAAFCFRSPTTSTAHDVNSLRPGHSSFVYMMSVLMVSFVPLTTSSPECKRPRCWNSRTRPAFGTTSIRRFMPWE
jgi:hypothetical protein